MKPRMAMGMVMIASMMKIHLRTEEEKPSQDALDFEAVEKREERDLPPSLEPMDSVEVFVGSSLNESEDRYGSSAPNMTRKETNANEERKTTTSTPAGPMIRTATHPENMPPRAPET